MKNKHKSKGLRAFSLIEISIVVLIVGILIAGITQSSRLISLARINTAKSLTQGSPASSIPNMSVWFESASDSVFDDSNIEDGDKVRTWNDINPQASTKANLNADSIEGSDGKVSDSAPIYQTDIINGLPAICFNDTALCGKDTGLSNYLKSQNFPSIISGSATVFVVFRLSSAKPTSDGSLFGKLASSTKTNPNVKMSIKSTGVFSYQDNGGEYEGSETLNDNSNYIISVVYNKNSTSTSDTNTNDGIAFFQNGEGKGKLDTTSEPNIGADGALFVGQDGNSSYYKGYIGELIIYDRALKKEERQSVESYLGRKWGIKMVTASY